jgi:hypothetical protein
MKPITSARHAVMSGYEKPDRAVWDGSVDLSAAPTLFNLRRCNGTAITNLLRLLC